MKILICIFCLCWAWIAGHEYARVKCKKRFEQEKKDMIQRVQFLKTRGAN